MVRIERCDDEGCPGFGEQYVDRGYGYPVCPANALNPNPVPMDERYIGQFAGELVAGTVCNAPGTSSQERRGGPKKSTNQN